MSRHIFESLEETGEVRVVVELLDFGERGASHPVTLTQFEQRGRLNRAFEMQMELGFRERENEAGRLRRHAAILKDWGSSDQVNRSC